VNVAGFLDENASTDHGGKGDAQTSYLSPSKSLDIISLRIMQESYIWGNS